MQQPTSSKRLADRGVPSLGTRLDHRAGAVVANETRQIQGSRRQSRPVMSDEFFVRLKGVRPELLRYLRIVLAFDRSRRQASDDVPLRDEIEYQQRSAHQHAPSHDHAPQEYVAENQFRQARSQCELLLI
jgi:hypothetical protein